MNKPLSAQTFAATYQLNSAFLLLVLLLSGDVAFIILHCLNILLPGQKNLLLSIETDLGYAEFYQYLKWLWIIQILIFISFKERSLHYLAWITLFIYILLDDALQIHERVGDYLAANISFEPPLGLTGQDFGELAVSAVAGSILILPLIWTYVKGTMPFRKISQDLLLLILLLIFFGVALDTAHSAIYWGVPLGLLLGLIEDGGEMATVSLILGYLFMYKTRKHQSARYLIDDKHEAAKFGLKM